MEGFFNQLIHNAANYAGFLGDLTNYNPQVASQFKTNPKEFVERQLHGFDLDQLKDVFQQIVFVKLITDGFSGRGYSGGQYSGNGVQNQQDYKTAGFLSWLQSQESRFLSELDENLKSFDKKWIWQNAEKNAKSKIEEQLKSMTMKQVEIVLTALTLFNSFKNRETSSGRIPELSEAPRVLRPSPAVDHSQISTASQGYQDQSGRHHHSNQGYQHNYDHNQIPNVSQGHQSQGYTQSSYYNQASHNPSNYSNPHSSNTSYSTRRHQQPPLPKMDFSQVTNVSKNFKEQLSQMTVGESNLSEVYSTTPQTPKTTTFGPSDLEKAEINRLELQKDEEERKREERLFEIEMSNQRASNERREEEMREKKTEMDHLADLEFQKKYAEQAKRHEESYRRAREEIEDYEKETQRLLEDQIRQWKACNNTFLACVQMKHLFEKKEKEWSDWLNTLGSAINSAKARFRLFENLLRSLDRSQPSFERIVKSELLAIHKSTLSAYDLIFEAYETIQNLFEKFPERVFLQTLLQSLVSVSDQICATLENIDYGLENIDLIDPIRQSFSRLSRWEIPSTSKLREESKNENVGVLIGKPRVYNAGSSLRISEIY